VTIERHDNCTQAGAIDDNQVMRFFRREHEFRRFGGRRGSMNTKIRHGANLPIAAKNSKVKPRSDQSARAVNRAIGGWQKSC
jgi:hypothetical protein